MPTGIKHFQDSVLSVLFAFTEHANLLNITKIELQCPGGSCSAPPAAPGNVSLRAQKYLAESFQWAGIFLRWKDFSLPKFSLKTFDAWNKIVSRHILQEKLESLVRVLQVPEKVWWNGRWVVALQLQTGSFRDSDVVIRLGHWLVSSSCWNISAESVNSAKTKSPYSTWSNIPRVDKGVKWSNTHSEIGASQASRWTPRS